MRIGPYGLPPGWFRNGKRFAQHPHLARDRTVHHSYEQPDLFTESYLVKDPTLGLQNLHFTWKTIIHSSKNDNILIASCLIIGKLSLHGCSTAFSP